METCDVLCALCSQINWLWYIVSVVIAFAIGAIWYSFLFNKAWVEVFNIKMPPKEEMKTSDMVLPMIIQFIATALIGLFFFILTTLSFWLSIVALVAFAAWQKATIKFHIINFRQFIKAAAIEVGYFAIAAMVFILFAML